MTKTPEGVRVVVRWPDAECRPVERFATVVRHGRNAGGVYTEVRFEDDGSTEQVHRSLVTRARCLRCGHGPHNYGATLRLGRCLCRNHPRAKTEGR